MHATLSRYLETFRFDGQIHELLQRGVDASHKTWVSTMHMKNFTRSNLLILPNKKILEHFDSIFWLHLLTPSFDSIFWLHLLVELHDALLAGVGGARQEAGDGHAALRTGLHSRLCAGRQLQDHNKNSFLIGLSHEISIPTDVGIKSKNLFNLLFSLLWILLVLIHKKAVIVQRNYWRCFENSVRRQIFKSSLFLCDHLFETELLFYFILVLLYYS